jgi:hypothetical protein
LYVHVLRHEAAMTGGSKLYPVKVDGETRHVTVPGSGDPQPGPETEAEFETFLAEAVEAYAESSEIARPQVSTFAEAGVLTENRGLVVRIGAAEFQLRIVRSR